MYKKIYRIYIKIIDIYNIYEDNKNIRYINNRYIKRYIKNIRSIIFYYTHQNNFLLYSILLIFSKIRICMKVHSLATRMYKAQFYKYEYSLFVSRYYSALKCDTACVTPAISGRSRI